MSDYNLKVTVRNGRILKAIEEGGYKSQSECARAMGVHPGSLNNIVAMRVAPIAKHTGRLIDIAQQLCDHLCKLPEDLWTEEQLFANLPRNTYTVDVSSEDAARLQGDAPALLRRIVSSTCLTQQQQTVIADRFLANDGEGLTLDETGANHNVTRERIRQIEAKALRKLREGVLYAELPEGDEDGRIDLDDLV